MNREDIIRMAREAGLQTDTTGVWVDDGYIEDQLTRFATLVAAAERERTWTQDHWTEYERSIAAAEREACAQECIEQLAKWNADKSDVNVARGCARAIRARGKK